MSTDFRREMAIIYKVCGFSWIEWIDLRWSQYSHKKDSVPFSYQLFESFLWLVITQNGLGGHFSFVIDCAWSIRAWVSTPKASMSIKRSISSRPISRLKLGLPCPPKKNPCHWSLTASTHQLEPEVLTRLNSLLPYLWACNCSEPSKYFPMKLSAWVS